MKSSILVLDTKDDRREIWHLLHRLRPWRRVDFLKRACAAVRAKDPRGNGPVPTGFYPRIVDAEHCDRGDERLTNAVYADLIALANQWDVDLVALAVELEQLVRRHPSSAPNNS